MRYCSFIPSVLDYQQQTLQTNDTICLAHLFLHRSLCWMTTFRCKFLYSLFCAWLLPYLVQLKSDSHLPKTIYFICCNDSPSKIMKNAFYFILKTLLVLKIFKFLSWHFGNVKKPSLIRRIRLISKFKTSQTGSERITTHILLNISWMKDNLTMKFSQLIEHPKRNIFL